MALTHFHFRFQASRLSGSGAKGGPGPIRIHHPSTGVPWRCPLGNRGSGSGNTPRAGRMSCDHDAPFGHDAHMQEVEVRLQKPHACRVHSRTAASLDSALQVNLAYTSRARLLNLGSRARVSKSQKPSSASQLNKPSVTSGFQKSSLPFEFEKSDSTFGFRIRISTCSSACADC